MTEEEFKKSLKTTKSFKNKEEEKEYLHEVIKYWLINYSPAVHLSVQQLNGSVVEVGWLHDVPFMKGGNQELALLRRAFVSIKKNTTFAS